MGSKKGSHIGIVLSFAIFIIFLIFLFSTVAPLITDYEYKQYVLEDVRDKLIDFSSETLTTFTIYLSDPNPDKDCVKIQNILDEIQNEENLVIKDDLDRTRTYAIEGQALVVDIGLSSNGLLRFYYSNGINSSIGSVSGGCDPITPSEYSITNIRTDMYNFEVYMFELLENYTSNYEGFKTGLEIPTEMDFGFSFVLSDGTIIGTEEQDVATSVYSEESLIMYLDTEGGTRTGTFTVQVW